jgi:methyl-accepting chemotaxis protein
MAMSNRIHWYQTIRIKLIAVIILTTSLVLGVTGYFAYKYIENSEQAELAQLAEVSATRLSQHLVIPMWTLDREQVGELLAAEMQEQRVAAIIVRDEDNSTLFAAKEKNNNGEVVESVGSVSGDFINVDREVLNGEDRIGVVSIFVTPRLMKQDLKNFGQGVVATVVVLNVVIFIIMMLVLGKVLINPLMKLAMGAEKISRGDLNQSFDISSRDEIGYLATTFNKMQSSLRVAIRRLTKSAKA